MVATGFLIAILDGTDPMPGATGVPDSDVSCCDSLRAQRA